MNELQQDRRDKPLEPGAGDFFVIQTRFSSWYISTEMARFIEGCMDARTPAKWVKFVDLAGARIRLRVREIESIAQCTTEQRATEREFFRAMRRENKADRDWDCCD